MKKRVLASLLALCMVIGMLPVTVLAAEASQVTEGSNGGVAKIGNTTYPTLAEAVTYAVADDTIVMLADVTLSETVKVTADKTITLDLNGKTIDGTERVNIALMSYGGLTLKDSSAGQTGIIKAGKHVEDGKHSGNTINICNGTFTMESGNIYSVNNGILVDENVTSVELNGGTITAEKETKNSAALCVQPYNSGHTEITIDGSTFEGYFGILISKNTKLTIESGSITGVYGTGLQGNGTYDSTEIKITGGTIVGGEGGIYHPQGGTMTISGDAAISGGTGVVVKGGIVNISGGTISATGDKVDYEPESSGFKGTGDALYVEHYDNSTNSENYGTPVVTVTGGTFTSANGAAVASYVNPNKDIEALDNFISGGTFSDLSVLDHLGEDADVVIKMAEDVELTNGVTIPASATVTLDLNGKTISQSKECTDSYSMIANNGSLTITGNGKLSFTDTGVGCSGTEWASYTICNAGTLVVENGTIEHLGTQSGNLNNAIFNYSGSTTINGGTISIPYSRSVRLWHGTVTINDGSFDGQVWVQAMENCSLTINGGSFKPATNGYDGSSVFVTNSTHVPTLSVTGGTFETKIGCSDASKLAGAITGGKFTESAKTNTNAALLAESCSFGEIGNDGYYTVIDTRPVENTTTGVKYDTLAGAISSAQAGDTITLLENVTLTETLTVTKNVVIDLNEHAVTGPSGNYGFIFNVEEGASLTVKNGTLNSSGYAIGSAGAATTANKIILDTVIINAETVGIYHNGSYYGADVTITESTIEVEDGCGVFLSGSAGWATSEKKNSLVITESTIIGDTAVEVKCGDVTVTDSTLEAGLEVAERNSVSGNCTVGYALALTNGGTAQKAEASMGIMTINSGVFTGVIGIKDEDSTDVVGNTTDAKITIYGGTFSTDPTAYLAEGYVATKNGSTWTVAIPTPAAKVGETSYFTLDAAIAAAQKGDTVTLLKDIVTSTYIEISKPLTLNLNGFDIIREGNGTGISVEDIALNEVVNIVGEGTIDAGTQALMALGGTVNIYGGTFVGGKAVLADYDSQVSIYGGTFSSKEQDGNVLAMGNACTTAFIKVYGGTFLNFDPANYVADGYVSVAGSNNTYTIAVKTVTGVTLDKVSLAMNPGDTATLTAAVSPADALNREISWSSDNTAVATVENGTVIAVAAGTATITVTTADGGYTATCEVTVADNSGAGEPEPEPEPTPTPTPDYSDDDYVPSNPTVSTETTENEDGSTTTTETKQDGTTVETTTNSDGSSTKTETKTEVKETAGTTTTTTTSKVETKDAEGNKTSVESTEKVVETVDTTIKTTETTTTTEARIETVKTEEKVVTDENGTKTTTTTTETATKLDNGSTGTTKTDETGKTEAAVEVSTQAVAEAAKAEAPVVLAMPALEVSKQAETSATVTVTLPADTAEAAVAIPVAESAGEGTVAVLVNDDGTETILTNAVITESGLVANVPNGATVKVVDNSADFHDVADDAWEKGAVDFTSSRNITNGTGAGFSPDMVTSRAMVWTMLARLEGVNTDPAEGEDWWTAGQKWAVENGISDGTNADGEITREQLAVMLYRYVGEPEYNHEIGYFEDHDETSDWALAGKKWAVGNKVINGKDNADGSLSLDPTGSASRAETAQIIMNFIKNIKA